MPGRSIGPTLKPPWRARLSAPSSTWRRSRPGASRSTSARMSTRLGLILYDMLVGRRRPSTRTARSPSCGARMEGSCHRCEIGRCRTIPEALDRVVARVSNRIRPTLPDDDGAGRRPRSARRERRADADAGACGPAADRRQSSSSCSRSRRDVVVLAARHFLPQPHDAGIGADRRLPERHQRSDIRPHAGADAQASRWKARASSARTTGAESAARSACGPPRNWMKRRRVRSR